MQPSMAMMWLVARLLVLTGLLHGTHGCPLACHCMVGFLDCSEQNLTSLPAGMNGTVLRGFVLDASRNKIQTITATSLDGFRQAASIQLQFNNISSIEEGAFANIPYLKTIDLSNNNLLLIIRNVFNQMALISLNLNYNVKLRGIQAGAFEGSAINELYLSNCNIVELGYNTFSDIQQSLKKFHLAYNKEIIGLPKGMLQGFQLKELSMKGTIIESPLFLEDMLVEILDLSSTQLGDRFWKLFSKIKNVQELIVNDMGLATVQLYTEATSLRVLHIMHNSLSNLDWSQFRYMPRLYTLNLKNNFITHLPSSISSYLPNLTVLDASNNKVTQIPPSTFDRSTIRFLMLENNQMSTLDERLQPFFSSLSQLNIANNPLHCNCQLRWFNRWLKELPFGSTRTDTPYCSSPGRVNILSLQDSDMACREPRVTGLQSDTVGIQCNATGDPAPDLIINITHQTAVLSNIDSLELFLSNLTKTVNINTESSTIRAMLAHSTNVSCWSLVVSASVECLAMNRVGSDNASISVEYNVTQVCDTTTAASFPPTVATVTVVVDNVTNNDSFTDVTTQQVTTSTADNRTVTTDATQNVTSPDVTQNVTSSPGTDVNVTSSPELTSNTTTNPEFTQTASYTPNTTSLVDVTDISDSGRTSPEPETRPPARDDPRNQKTSEPGISAGEIAAITIACILVMVIMCIICAYCVVWSKRSRRYNVATDNGVHANGTVSYINKGLEGDTSDVHFY